MLGFLAVSYATLRVAGAEEHVYYRDQNAILLLIALFLLVIGEPVLRYLDIAILGLGTFLACGRVGCLLVGCCHGRAVRRFGVRYGEAQVKDGFPRELEDVRLFPVQAVESLMVAAIVAVGCTVVLSGAEPGEALAWYVVAYGLGRFFLEFARGDSARPYYKGFSEAQWTSLALIAGVAMLELTGVLVWHVWHAVAAGVVAASMVALAVKRKLDPTRRFELLHAKHLEAVAEAIRHHSFRAAGFMPPVRVFETPLGIRISSGIAEDGGRTIEHYSFSSTTGPLSAAQADLLAGLVSKLRGRKNEDRIIEGNGGIYHLLFPG